MCVCVHRFASFFSAHFPTHFVSCRFARPRLTPLSQLSKSQLASPLHRERAWGSLTATDHCIRQGRGSRCSCSNRHALHPSRSVTTAGYPPPPPPPVTEAVQLTYTQAKENKPRTAAPFGYADCCDNVFCRLLVSFPCHLLFLHRIRASLPLRCLELGARAEKLYALTTEEEKYFQGDRASERVQLGENAAHKCRLRRLRLPCPAV